MMGKQKMMGNRQFSPTFFPSLPLRTVPHPWGNNFHGESKFNTQKTGLMSFKGNQIFADFFADLSAKKRQIQRGIATGRTIWLAGQPNICLIRHRDLLPSILFYFHHIYPLFSILWPLPLTAPPPHLGPTAKPRRTASPSIRGKWWTNPSRQKSFHFLWSPSGYTISLDS